MDINKNESNWWQPALQVGLQISGWIAGPIVLALFLGRWLDQKYQTEPWLFLLSMGVAFILSSVGIVRLSLKYIKQIEREAELQKQEDKLKKNNEQSRN